MSAQGRGPRWPTTATDNGTSCGWRATVHAAGTAGWEQRELATMCGVGLSTFSDWERGRRKAPRVVLEFLKWALKLNVATIKRAVKAKRTEQRAAA